MRRDGGRDGKVECGSWGKCNGVSDISSTLPDSLSSSPGVNGLDQPLFCTFVSSLQQPLMFILREYIALFSELENRDICNVIYCDYAVC